MGFSQYQSIKLFYSTLNGCFLFFLCKVMLSTSRGHINNILRPKVLFVPISETYAKFFFKVPCSTLILMEILKGEIHTFNIEIC